MSSDTNVVIVTGRLGSDPQSKSTSGGTPLADLPPGDQPVGAWPRRRRGPRGDELGERDLLAACGDQKREATEIVAETLGLLLMLGACLAIFLA